MTDEKNMQLAKRVYQTLCESIERRNWKYGKDEDEDKLIVHFGVNGEDIPMDFVIIVDAGRQLIRLISPLPFKMSESKRMDGAVAVCAASYGMSDGSFDYDLSDGTITFRMTASFRESIIGEGLFDHMISLSCAIVDDYNDQFLALNKGLMSIKDFIAKKNH